MERWTFAPSTAYSIQKAPTTSKFTHMANFLGLVLHPGPIPIQFSHDCTTIKIHNIVFFKSWHTFKNTSWLLGLGMKCWQGPTHEVYLQQQKLQFVPQYETNHPPQPWVCCCLLNIFSQHGGDISDPVALEIHPVSAQSVVANSSDWMCCQGTRAVCMTEIPETETIPQHVPSQAQKTSDYIHSGLQRTPNCVCCLRLCWSRCSKEL